MIQGDVPPRIAVVIVNYRTPDLTGDCLDALDSAADGLEYEAVVVDNDSGDGSADQIKRRHPSAKVVPLAENRGFAAGVNEGFATTSADVVVLLNPDTRPEPGAVLRLVEHLVTAPRAGVAAPILTFPDGSFQRSAHRRFPNLATAFVTFCAPLSAALARTAWHPHELTEAETLRGGRVAHVSGAALAVRREAFAAAGPFDEGFFLYLEETEWQRRLRRAGWEIELVPEARVTHIVGSGRAEAAPSLHYLASLYRYLELQGVSAAALDATIAVAASISYATLSAVGLASRRRRRAARQLMDSYRGYLEYILARRARRHLA